MSAEGGWVTVESKKIKDKRKKQTKQKKKENWTEQFLEKRAFYAIPFTDRDVLEETRRMNVTGLSVMFKRTIPRETLLQFTEYCVLTLDEPIPDNPAYTHEVFDIPDNRWGDRLVLRRRIFPVVALNADSEVN